MPSIKQLVIHFIGNENFFEHLNVKIEFILILLIQSFYMKIIITIERCHNIRSSGIDISSESVSLKVEIFECFSCNEVDTKTELPILKVGQFELFWCYRGGYPKLNYVS